MRRRRNITSDGIAAISTLFIVFVAVISIHSSSAKRSNSGDHIETSSSSSLLWWNRCCVKRRCCCYCWWWWARFIDKEGAHILLLFFWLLFMLCDLWLTRNKKVQTTHCEILSNNILMEKSITLQNIFPQKFEFFFIFHRRISRKRVIYHIEEKKKLQRTRFRI